MLTNLQELLLNAQERDDGWRVGLYSPKDSLRAVLEPLTLETAEAVIQGRWNHVEASTTHLHAQGSVLHPQGTVRFTLAAHASSAGETLLQLDWQVQFKGACTGAVVHSVTLPEQTNTPLVVDLPGIHYGANTYGKGIFPRPDPRRGFSFRADRMGQPALHLATPQVRWNYFALEEAANPPQPDLVYALGMAPTEDGLHLFFRYPQYEYGQRGDGGPDAYVAKNLFARGENEFATWNDGATLTKTLYLWRQSPDANYGAVARFVWREQYEKHRTQSAVNLWDQAGEHIRWLNARLYNPNLGGGQYESPEGSNTAMLGFVEQSLLMASTTLQYVLWSRASSTTTFSLDEIRTLRARASDVLTRWATLGLSTEGLLYPVCDARGFDFGYREYGEPADLVIVKNGGFETLRLAGEARALLHARAAALANDEMRVETDMLHWERAVRQVAEWIAQHPLPGGGYASRYRRDGEPLDPYPAATTNLISFFCECARSFSDRGFLALAERAYADVVREMMRTSVFAGGTLDASTPDREAANAALDACIDLYEMTANPEYLDDARFAADNILSYILMYPISTFGADTDAAKNRVSTFGASIVSPENQHLDPVPCAQLLRYGLYAGDEVPVQAAIESLRWCLDGRWAIPEKQGVKQTEQLLNTRWYYNSYFMRRGDWRRGMPHYGRTDSEHGWPQVVPAASLLVLGQVTADWESGRAVGVDAWSVVNSYKESPDTLVLELAAPAAPTSFLFKLLRPPVQALRLRVNQAELVPTRLQWLYGLMVDAPASGHVTLRVHI